MEFLSEYLDINEKALWRLLSLVRKERAYTRFEIPKRIGGNRKIDKPIEALFIVQRRIKSRILDSAPELPSYVTAFRPGFSIRDNATPHCNKALLVKFDLKDFFASVSFSRVLKIFESLDFESFDAKTLAYLTTIRVPEVQTPISSLHKFEKQRLAETLDSACCYLRGAAGSMSAVYHGSGDFGDLGYEASELRKAAVELQTLANPKTFNRRGLPQGAPTSPQLANLAVERLDRRLFGLAKSLRFEYTRYADDLSFSSFDATAKVNVLIWAVNRIVSESGFLLNTSKTAIMRAPCTRQTTGLVVNDSAPRVRRCMVRRVRAMLHQKRIGKLEKDQIFRLAGYLSYIRMINPEQADRLEMGQRSPD